MSLLGKAPDLRRARKAFVLATAYFCCASLTLQLTRFDGGVAIVWSAGALLFARLAAAPARDRLLMVLPCFPTGIAAAELFGFGHGVAVPLACVGVLEAWAAAAILRRFCPRFGRFQSVSDVTRFLAVAGVGVPAASAVIGASFAHATGAVPFWPTWRDWYAGHALGMVVFAPPLLLAFRGEVKRWVRTGRRRRLETSALLGAVAVAAVVTFGQNTTPIVLVPFVPMLAATFRLGRFGAVASILILVCVGMSCSLMGYGPTTLLHGSMSFRLQVLQIYFATTVLILLPVAAELKARRRLLERLKAAEALHRLILDRTSDIVIRLGLDGEVRYASPSIEQFTGYTTRYLLGRPVFELLHPEDVASVRATQEAALSDPGTSGVVEYRIIRPDGTIVWVESHTCATTSGDGDVTGMVSIIRETTERRRAIEELERRAASDPLTGLSNRRAFDAALADRLRCDADGGRPAYLAVFDIDHFKSVNDRHGHPVGDAVLIHFADILRSSIRDEDVVARLGGEEFAVLLGDATREQASLVCERIRSRFATNGCQMASGETVYATVSAGIASLPGKTAEDLLATADAALYRAKAEGRNRLALAA